MAHPLVLALFATPAAAATAARALHAHGVERDQISVVSRSHDEEGALADQMDASPGADIEDSRPAARLGELSGLVLAAIAVGMPGIGAIVAAGPLAAGLGEAAGHVAGGVASTLKASGVPGPRARQMEEAVERDSGSGRDREGSAGLCRAARAPPDQLERGSVTPADSVLPAS
jgi:hypothetical protein